MKRQMALHKWQDNGTFEPARVLSKVPRFLSRSLCPQLFKWTHSVDPNLPDQGDDGGM